MRSTMLSSVSDGEWLSCLERRGERNRVAAALLSAVALHLVTLGLPLWLNDREPPRTALRASAHGEIDVGWAAQPGRDGSTVEHLVSVAAPVGGAERSFSVAGGGLAASKSRSLARTASVDQTARRDQHGKAASQERGGRASSGAGAASGDIFGGLFDYTGPMTLHAEFCTLPASTESIADLGECNDLGAMQVKRINVPLRHHADGLPGAGTRTEFIGARYTGTFVVKRSGTHQFRLLSDDGSQLFIDGSLVIDNDGLHGVREVSRSIELEAGTHAIMVRYFQGPGEQIALQLFVRAPHVAERLFTTHVW